MAFETTVQEITLNNAGVYSRGLKSMADLTDEDKLRFGLLVGIKMAYCYSGFIQYHKGLIGDEMWQAYRASMRAWVTNPNARAIWQEHLAWYPQGFQKVAQEIMASISLKQG